MIGTITNVCAITVGCLIGCSIKKKFKQEWQNAMFTSMGLASLSLGFNAVCRNMPNSQYPVLFIFSMTLGSLVGTMLHIDQRMKSLVDKLQNKKGKAHQSNDAPRLAEGLTTAVLLFCIGTLSILGPINSALLNDNTFLYTNATLDFVSSAIFAATYGIGMVLAAPILFCWQGSIYMIAKMCGNIISDELLCEMSIIGGTLIATSGLAILKIKDCKTLNMLPALLVPIIFFIIKSLF